MHIEKLNVEMGMMEEIESKVFFHAISREMQQQSIAGEEENKTHS